MWIYNSYWNWGVNKGFHSYLISNLYWNAINYPSIPNRIKCIRPLVRKSFFFCSKKFIDQRKIFKRLTFGKSDFCLSQFYLWLQKHNLFNVGWIERKLLFKIKNAFIFNTAQNKTKKSTKNKRESVEKRRQTFFSHPTRNGLEENWKWRFEYIEIGLLVQHFDSFILFRISCYPVVRYILGMYNRATRVTIFFYSNYRLML